MAASSACRSLRAERERAPASEVLAPAVAANPTKLMACRDGYEVARLYSDGEFARNLARVSGGDRRLRFHLAPPLLARRDPRTGEPRKRGFGPWILPAFRLLARLKGLRGTAFDIFGHTSERRTEMHLVSDYLSLLDEISGNLTPANHEVAMALAALPSGIRGFGHVKAAPLERAEARREELPAAFKAPRLAAAA